MSNPWETIALSDYETHMNLPEIHQLSALNEIMNDQFRAYPARTAAIWGIAGGNGLERVPETIETIHGIDINSSYLDACVQRFPALQNRLVLHQIDMTDCCAPLPKTELVVANLFLEYLGLPLFVQQIGRVEPCFVSCVLQKNAGDQLVSSSPYAAAFDGLAPIHREISADALTHALFACGYSLCKQEETPLPNGKALIRLDYKK